MRFITHYNHSPNLHFSAATDYAAGHTKTQ